MYQLPFLWSDVVLHTIYPEKGSHCNRESPAYDINTSLYQITWPSSQLERYIRSTNTISDPSFGVVINTISHWYSSTLIIFHNTTQTRLLTECNLIEIGWLGLDGKWRGMYFVPPAALPRACTLLGSHTKILSAWYRGRFATITCTFFIYSERWTFSTSSRCLCSSIFIKGV